MEDVVYTPGGRDIKSVRRGADVFKDCIGAKAFRGELLGWGVSAEVVRLQPDSISDSEAEVLSPSIGVALVYFLCLFDSKLAAGLHLMDVMESFGEGQGLLIRGTVRVDGVVTIIRVERCHAYRRVEMVIVGEFSGM